MTTTKIKSMSNEALRFTRQDLREVIECQEAMNRAGIHVPKLGQYWDDLGAVVTEMKRRGIYGEA